MEPTPSVPDLLIRIMQQQDAGFAEIRQSQSKLGETMARIDRDVALLQHGSEQMREIPRRVQALETSRDIHARQLADTERHQIEHRERLGGLEGAAAHRTGWEKFGGKLLYIAGGALASAIVTSAAMALRG